MRVRAVAHPLFLSHPIMERNKTPLVVTIMASPRLNGNTAALLDEAERSARAAGAEVKHLTLSHLNVRPCVGCMKCRITGTCALPHDDAHDIASLIHSADSIIIAMPVYWGSMPGTLKVLLDRLVYAFIDTSSPHRLPKPLQRGARLGVICSCTAPWPLSLTQTKPAVKSLRRIFRQGGFTVYPALCLTGTRSLTAPKPSALKAAASLGDLLARPR